MPAEFYRHGTLGITDLESLSSKASGSALSVSLNLGDRLDSLEGLRHLRPDLDSLSLGAQWVRNPWLTPLRRFTHLRKLALHTTAGRLSDLEVIAELGSLQQLQLYGVKPFDLDLLTPLKRLVRLDLNGGRQVGPWSTLASLPALKTLELSRIPGITDLSGVEQSQSLERLDLHTLSNLEQLPDFSIATHLKVVLIERLRLLKDLRPLAAAPALEQLALVNMPQIGPADLEPLLGHPSLTHLTVGTGSARRNAALQELHQLPGVQLEDPSLD